MRLPVIPGYAGQLGPPAEWREYLRSRLGCTESFEDNANQIEFVNPIIDDLTQHGVIEARRFDESPYTDVAPRGPDDLFTSADVDRLINTLAAVRAGADVA